MIFEKDGLTLEFRYPAQYPMKEDTELVQARDKSSSGVVHVEDFEVKTNSISFTFTNMPDSDYVALIQWFLDVAVGMLNEFYLTDDLNIRRLVRFTTPKLLFIKDSFNLRSGSFSVEQVQ